MSLIERIVKKLNNLYKNTDKKYTIVKFDVRNGCCTSQANNDFEMTLKQLSFTESIYYLFEECYPWLHSEFNDALNIHYNDDYDEDNIDSDDEDDDKQLFFIVYNGLKAIMEKKRLSTYHCDCGLDFFIFNEGDKIIIDNSDFFNSEYDMHSYFIF